MSTPKGIGPTLEQVRDSFRYHQPDANDILRISNIRAAFIGLVEDIWDNVPEGADRTAALRKLHECMMTCNKAIVCEPKP